MDVIVASTIGYNCLYASLLIAWFLFFVDCWHRRQAREDPQRCQHNCQSETSAGEKVTYFILSFLLILNYEEHRRLIACLTGTNGTSAKQKKVYGYATLTMLEAAIDRILSVTLCHHWAVVFNSFVWINLICAFTLHLVAWMLIKRAFIVIIWRYWYVCKV